MNNSTILKATLMKDKSFLHVGDLWFKHSLSNTINKVCFNGKKKETEVTNLLTTKGELK